MAIVAMLACEDQTRELVLRCLEPRPPTNPKLKDLQQQKKKRKKRTKKLYGKTKISIGSESKENKMTK